MIETTDIRHGKILLLAPHDSFSAHYIGHALDIAGIPTLRPTGSPLEELATLAMQGWASISACLVVDLGESICAEVARQASSVPFLFVGSDAAPWLPNPDMWLRPPFASFQVLDRLQWMFQTFMPHQGPSRWPTTNPSGDYVRD